MECHDSVSNSSGIGVVGSTSSNVDSNPEMEVELDVEVKKESNITNNSKSNNNTNNSGKMCNININTLQNDIVMNTTGNMDDVDQILKGYSDCITGDRKGK